MSKENVNVPYREVTFAAVVLGVLQGCIMTMAFVYAGLKLGFTLPGSTIAAIMGFALLKGVLKKGTIVENNINQTIASGVNIASAGLVFTLPVLFMMMKEFNPIYVAIASIGGSFLGVSVIIPLRKQMIDFDRLRFPSGTAVAAILKSPGAGKEKAVLLGIGFLCSMVVIMLMHAKILPHKISLSAIGLNFPVYTQTAISLSLMNIGAGLLSGKGGLPFFFGGCLAFWFIGPVGVNMGFVPETVMAAEVTKPGPLTDFVYLKWLRPTGIGMLIGGALMGVVMAFPSIKSALSSLANASKSKSGTSQDELPVKFIVIGLVSAFVVLFFGSLYGITDDTWLCYKGTFNDFKKFSTSLQSTSDPIKVQIFKGLPKKVQEAHAVKLPLLLKNQSEALEKFKKSIANEEKKVRDVKLQSFREGPKKVLDRFLIRLQRSTITGLNVIIRTPGFFKENLVTRTLSTEVKKLLDKNSTKPLEGLELQELNRRILGDVFPKEINKVKNTESKQVGVGRALIISLVATIWLALAGIIVAQCTGITDISPLSGLSLIAVTLILILSSNSVIAAVILGVAVCVATAQCADMMQDLKTGYLVGGIPRRQQYTQIAVAWLGPIVALVTIYILDAGPGFGPGTDLVAPQAGAMQGLIEGITEGNIPTGKYVCGGVLGGILSMLPGGGMGVLVGLAMYLPFYITLGYGIGCFISIGITKWKGVAWSESKIVPLAAGFIVGEAMTELGYSIYAIFAG